MDLMKIMEEELMKQTESDLDRKIRQIEQETEDFLRQKDPLLEDIKRVKDQIASVRGKMLRTRNVKNHRKTELNAKNHQLRQKYKIEISKLQDELEALETEYKGRDKTK